MRRAIVTGALVPAVLLAGAADGAERELLPNALLDPSAVVRSAGASRDVSRPPCRQRLAERGIKYTRGPAARGVGNPVTVALPLGGISYHAPGVRRPQRRLFLDCTLALVLHTMGRRLRSRGVDAVEHLGIYEYRCIEGTSPCVLSQHATATGIDLHEFRGRRGRSYNVERDWVIDPGSRSTCSAARRASRGDRFLHRLACQWSRDHLFNVVLTPNFNAAHRNHFHLDLTPGEHFIR